MKQHEKIASGVRTNKLVILSSTVNRDKCEIKTDLRRRRGKRRREFCGRKCKMVLPSFFEIKEELPLKMASLSRELKCFSTMMLLRQQTHIHQRRNDDDHDIQMQKRSFLFIFKWENRSIFSHGPRSSWAELLSKSSAAPLSFFLSFPLYFHACNIFLFSLTCMYVYVRCVSV